MKPFYIGLYITFTLIIFQTCQSSTEGKQAERLNIQWTKASLDSIENFRNQALKQGWISRKLKKYVPIKLGNHNAFTKLKGDWCDHLKTDQWSLRIKTKDTSILGCNIFSIQHPKTRDYIAEYLLHQWCEKEDLLTTKYEFINVSWDDNHKGYYAFEEHFNWPLLERYKRPKSPILKFDEDDYFQNLKWRWSYKTKIKPPILQSALIDLYQSKDVLKDSLLATYWQRASELLYQYQFDLKPASEIFDLSNAAKYYAIISITKSYHALAWHNQRFYYNPNTRLLEHILYDGSNKEAKSWIYNKPIYGLFNENQLFKTTAKSFHINLFQSKEFIDKYLHYLAQYSDSSYLKKMLEINTPSILIIDQNLSQYEEAISSEKIQNTWIDNANEIANSIEQIKKKLIENYEGYGLWSLKEIDFEIDTTSLKHPYPEILVKSYHYKDSIMILNFHTSEIEIENEIIPAYNHNWPPPHILISQDIKSFTANNRKYKLNPRKYSNPTPFH